MFHMATVVEQSKSNSRQDTIQCHGVRKKGFLEEEALEDGKIRIDQDIEKGIPGEESNVKKGHEVRWDLLCWVNGEFSLVRQKVSAGGKR